jgi:hypothetical protein
MMSHNELQNLQCVLYGTLHQTFKIACVEVFLDLRTLCVLGCDNFNFNTKCFYNLHEHLIQE